MPVECFKYAKPTATTDPTSPPFHTFHHTLLEPRKLIVSTAPESVMAGKEKSLQKNKVLLHT
jgi:hypothetical protein